MTLSLYAQPYDLAATGFAFESLEEFRAKARGHCNTHGQPVEEYELQVIDGDPLDIAVPDAIGINQANLGIVLERLADWSEHDKLRVIVAVGECGYRFDAETDPDAFDVDLYEGFTLRDLAHQYLEEGLFGDIPDRIACYLDMDAIARDLGCDYTETTIAGRALVYRCG